MLIPLAPELNPSLAAAKSTCVGVPSGTSSLVVTPANNPSLAAGSTLDFNVTNQAGVTVPDCAVAWSVSDSSVASISNVGTVVGKKVGGPVTVKAQSTGAKPLKGTAFVTIVAPVVPVATVTVTPGTASLTTGATQQFQAAARDANGNVLSGRTVIWISSNTTVITITSAGLATAIAAGTASVTATVDGKSTAAAVTVTVPDTRIYFDVSLDGTAAGEEIYSIRPDGTGLVQITNRYGVDLAPVLSPDKQKMAFSSELWCAPNCNIQPELYVMNIDGTNIIKLSSGMNPVWRKAWSPDGTQIVAEAQGGTTDPRARRLYKYSLSGAGPVQVSFEESQAPEWSPDGTKILYCAPAGVVTVDVNGGNRTLLRALTNPGSADPSCGRAAWSPDGTRIVFNLNSEQLNTEHGLWIMNADGSNAYAITTTMDYGPRWSPDGKSLTFFSREGTNGYYQIFTMAADGTGRKQLTTFNGHTYSPSWH